MHRLRRPRVILVVATALGLLLAGAALSRRVGGIFDGPPEALAESISPAARELIRAALADLDGKVVHDLHVHRVGLDTDGSGTYASPKMFSLRDPINYARGRAYMSGAAVTDLGRADQQYMERLLRLGRASPTPIRLHLLAFDYAHDAAGHPDPEHSTFYTPNETVIREATTHQDLLIPTVSIHPHRPDAIAELERCAALGVRMVKWLPNAQRIDASDSRHDAFYRALVAHDMILLTHVGAEAAVDADEQQRLGNPLLFRRPLDLGVRVVMAHVASSGDDLDLDDPVPGVRRASFELFLRLMDEPRYEGLLYGELSAVTLVNRLPMALATILDRSDLHERLVNGSDYPLPAINSVIWTSSLWRHGFITRGERAALNEIYAYNPLLFDLVTKRTVRSRSNGGRLPASVFTAENLLGSSDSVWPSPRPR